jgi:hypothetical protein
VATDGRAHATIADSGLGGYYRLVSEDGATWTRTGTFPGDASLLLHVEGGPDPALGVLVAVTDYEEAGPGVYRSLDGGLTWPLVGRVPRDTTVVGGAQRAKAALVGADGSLYVATTQNGLRREWVYRTVEGVTVAAEPLAPDVPEELALSVWPNPSRGGASVAFTLAVPGAVRVSVFDVLGREVTVLVDAARAAGRHTVAFDGRALPAGVYVVRVAAAGATAAHPVTLLGL